MAFAFNSWFLVRSWKRRARQRKSGEDGQLGRLAAAFVQVWAALVAADAAVLLAGAGLLTGHRPFGYLLALMPLISILVGVFALRGFE